jgi:hypothetical protein
MRSLLCRWLWLLLLALAMRAEALDLGPYGSLTANTVSAALVVTGLPAADSATVASLTSGAPATPKPGFRLFKPKPQAAPAVPAFDEAAGLEPEPLAHTHRRPRRPRLFDTGEIDAIHGHPDHDHFDDDDDCDACEAADEAHDRIEFDRVSITTEALLLKRDQTQNMLLAQAVTPAGVANGGGTLFLDAVQNFNNENGFRTDVTWRFSPGSAIQVAYFGQQEWAESAQVSAAAPNAFVQSPFLGTTIATADERFDTAIEADYNSQVHDGQLNWVQEFTQCPTERNRWLLGLRTFIFRDELQLIGVQTGGAVTERTSAVCYNEFIGAHFGLDVNYPLIDDRVTIGLASKAGLFVNFAELRLRNMGFPATGQPGSTLIDLTDNHTGLGQIVEAALQIKYRPFRFLTLRGGYQVLYARGLSLAPSNLLATGTSIRDVPQTAFPGSIPGGIDNDNTLTLDGAFMGAEFRF